MRAIASNGLPLKITAEWTENDYWDRQHEDTDDLTYRYTPGEGNTEAGKKIAIDRALGEARLTVW
jgi:hypothetical protein